MDILKTNINELRALEMERLREVEQDVRKSLSETRMDIFSAGGVNTGKKGKLRKTLARIMTVKSEKR